MNIKTFLLGAILVTAGNAMAQQSWTADNGNGTFTNPLFYDEFSDPDILRVGDDVAATRAMDGLLWMGAPRKTVKPRTKKPKFDDGLMKW